MSDLISSTRVEVRGGHDLVTVWNRGGNAGSLVVSLGDGQAVAERLDDYERLRSRLATLEAERDRLETLVERWECESHPWNDANGDPVTDPARVCRLTDAWLHVGACHKCRAQRAATQERTDNGSR